MAITQISAYLENRPGTLYDALAAITVTGANIRALSVAEASDFGILRLIVSDAKAVEEVLSKDFVVKETPVIAARMDDKTGALKNILGFLKDAGVNVEYVYAFTGAEQGSAYVVLRVDNIPEAESILSKNSIAVLNDEDMAGFLA